MYSVTSKLCRIVFEDKPTTAIVLHSFRISVMGSLPSLVRNSEPSGTRTLIASQTRPSLLVSLSLAPLPPNIFHFLPRFPPKSAPPQESPSTQAAARSRLYATAPH